MKIERGNYAVERDCCTSGQCFDCTGRKGRLRVVQLAGLDERTAKAVAANWRAYHPRVVPI